MVPWLGSSHSAKHWVAGSIVPIILSSHQFSVHASPQNILLPGIRPFSSGYSLSLSVLLSRAQHPSNAMLEQENPSKQNYQQVDCLPALLHLGGPSLKRVGVGISALAQDVPSILATHRVLARPLRVSGSGNTHRDNCFLCFLLFPSHSWGMEHRPAWLFQPAEWRRKKMRNHGRKTPLKLMSWNVIMLYASHPHGVWMCKRILHVCWVFVGRNITEEAKSKWRRSGTWGKLNLGRNSSMPGLVSWGGTKEVWESPGGWGHWKYQSQALWALQG